MPECNSDKGVRSRGPKFVNVTCKWSPRPTFPGMMRSIRKNFFNIVIMCDPSRRESRALLKNLEAFYVHRAPTRIGIVFTVNDSPEVSGMDDAGVALLDAFNYISGNSQV